MENIFRSLSFTITQLVYPLISYLYNIFELIAKNQFFTNSDIEALSQNIYIIISACMLFTLGLKLLSAIVNPDALDGESGGKGTKRTAKSIFFSILIALFLIILIPIGFNWLYTIQSNDKETGILDRHLVEKIVLGTDTTEDHVPGQILASYAFASFCHPKETVSVESIANDGGNLYNLAITENIEYIRDMDGVINSRTDGEYDIEYHAILSPAVGLFLTYEMILICIDIALRSIKLGLLQLITSVVLCGYVVAGSDLLKRWAKEVMSTYLIVYIKIAAMSFMVYGLSLLEGFLDRLDFADDSAGFWSRGLIRVFVIIGLLQLVRQLPDLINKIFGTNIQRRGGIRGRLGEMAAVGDIAQRAWDQLRTHPLQTGQRLLSAPVSAIGGYFANRQAVMNKGDQVRRQVLENGGTEAQARRARRASQDLKSSNRCRLTARWPPTMAGSFGAMFRAGRAGWQNGNLQGIGEQGRRYDETHSADAIAYRANQGWAQRLNPLQNDNFRSALGLNSLYEQQQEEDKYVEYQGRRMTVDQLNNLKSQQAAITQQRNTIRDAAVDAITADDSNLRLDVAGLGHGNYQQLVNQLETMRNSAPVRATDASGAFTETEDEFNARVQAHAQRITDLENNLITARNNMRDAIIDYAADHDGDFTHINGAVVNGITFNAIVAGQNVISGRDQGIITTSLGTLAGMDVGEINSNDDLNAVNTAAQNEINAIDTALITHQQAVYEHQNSAEGRAQQGSHDATQARRNNANNNHGGNNH